MTEHDLLVLTRVCFLRFPLDWQMGRPTGASNFSLSRPHFLFPDQCWILGLCSSPERADSSMWRHRFSSLVYKCLWVRVYKVCSWHLTLPLRELGAAVQSCLRTILMLLSPKSKLQCRVSSGRHQVPFLEFLICLDYGFKPTIFPVLKPTVHHSATKSAPKNNPLGHGSSFKGWL